MLAIVDANSLFRAALASLLGTMGFNPIEQAANIGELSRRIGTMVPEILLVTIVAEADISQTMDQVKKWGPPSKVVFLAADLDLERLSGCFAAGASGYLLKTISPSALQECIRLVEAGEKVFPSQLASLIPGFALPYNNEPTTFHVSELRDSNLSDREIDILRCLANGHSNKVIANKLNIAESTVKVHVKRILQKTHACNRTQAALWGAARGLANT